MRYLIVLLLAGCSYNVALYPRGAGEIAAGTANTGSRTMEVNLRGETYKGSFERGQSVGIGFANAYGAGGSAFATGTGVSFSNQYTALLTSGRNTLRCEAMAENGHGNGVCVDGAGNVYDLKIGD